MNKLFLAAIIFYQALSNPFVANAQLQLPAFSSCQNPIGTIQANYDQGNHAIVGIQGLQSGSDTVYSNGDNNFTQCYCPLPLTNGIQTNWLAAGNISKEDQNVLITQGWILIPNGADWGLSAQPYLAKNTDFSCGGGGSTSGSGGTSSGSGGSTSNSTNSTSSNVNGQGGEVLGISMLAGTSSPYTKLELALLILSSIGLIIYGDKLQKKSK